MNKIITAIIAWLMPIVRQAALQVAADELNKAAYPRNRGNVRTRPYGSYATMPKRSHHMQPSLGVPLTGEGDDAFERALSGFDPEPSKNSQYGRTIDGFHDVLMLAMDITGPNMATVQAFISEMAPKPGDHAGGINVDAWWIADDTAGTSDCDSAVFVPKGSQAHVREHLKQEGII